MIITSNEGNDLKGKWNGFGGKVEPGETILQAAVR
jgi:8-oxo-dGTP pyrophosphatase MutT (NUDIX family)